MTAPSLPDLFFYSRPGCHLCDEARDMVIAVLAERAGHGLPVPVIVERDIETDPAWERAYLAEIPVVELGARRLELVTSMAKVRRLLSETLDEPVPAPR